MQSSLLQPSHGLFSFSFYSKTTTKAKVILDRAAALGILHLLMRNTGNRRIINMFYSPFASSANAAEVPPQGRWGRAVELAGELWDELCFSRVE